MHIGLIGGIGPAATAFYYRGLTRAFAAMGRKLELTIANAEVREMTRNMDARDPRAQAAIFAELIGRLKAAGAKAAAVTSMGGHFCIRELSDVSSLPLINAIPVLDQHFGTMGVKRIGLLGSRAVMESKFYGGVNSVEIVVPKGSDLDAVHERYVAMATAAVATDADRRFFLDAGKRLADEQCTDVVVLSGTDLFLAFEGASPGYRIADAAEIHIGAIVRAAMQDVS
ncbi:MAG: aspartate/glutamate racemase family protein [Alphaproteobacteria bacterium]|nr:aspartate/glutamate racemase family protein [Alphaproteobacteria bacterium]